MNLFKKEDVAKVITRINKLTPATDPQWGKMTVDQMLAHVNVSYEMEFTDLHPKPNAFMKLFLKMAVKNTVVGPTPYKKNSRTAPNFIITGQKDFEAEKARLVGYLNKVAEQGEAHYDQKESHSFGKLTTAEWNTLYYKHLNHHLTQFGV